MWRKGFGSLFILLIIGLFLSSAVFSYIYHYKVKNPIAIKDQSESMQAGGRIVWETGESKTEDFQLSFKYPSNWSIGGSPDKILMRPPSSENRPYYSININIKYKRASYKTESNKSKFVLNKEHDNYLAEITAEGTNLEMIKNDEILKEIYSSLIFTYTKPNCGNRFGDLTFPKSDYWTRIRGSCIDREIAFKNPEEELSSLSISSK